MIAIDFHWFSSGCPLMFNDFHLFSLMFNCFSLNSIGFPLVVHWFFLSTSKVQPINVS